MLKTLLSERSDCLEKVCPFSAQPELPGLLPPLLRRVRVLCSPERRVLEGSPCLPRSEESTPLDGGARVRVAGRKHLLHQAFCLRDGWLTKAPMGIPGKLPEPWVLLLNST